VEFLSLESFSVGKPNSIAEARSLAFLRQLHSIEFVEGACSTLPVMVRWQRSTA
jgi:hypothetical protein